jgi:hypothetical protein
MKKLMTSLLCFFLFSGPVFALPHCGSGYIPDECFFGKKNCQDGYAITSKDWNKFDEARKMTFFIEGYEELRRTKSIYYEPSNPNEYDEVIAEMDRRAEKSSQTDVSMLSILEDIIREMRPGEDAVRNATKSRFPISTKPDVQYVPLANDRPTASDKDNKDIRGKFAEIISE